MASMNFNPFDHWFSKPPKPLPPLNLLYLPKSLSFPFRPSAGPTTGFASLSSSSSRLFREAKALDDPGRASTSEAEAEEEEEEEAEAEAGGLDDPDEADEPGAVWGEGPEQEDGPYKEMLDQFYWECKNRPDYRYTPEVEVILNRDPYFEKKENPTEEEIKENEKFWKDMEDCPIISFLRQAEEIADGVNEQRLKDNDKPWRREDRELWQALPHVIGPDGRPMPRKAIKTQEESDDKFWDFMKEFLFGLWGFQQRPYPPGRPIDVAQAIGYKRLEDRFYDFIMKSGGFYYKDRLGRTRGPCELIQLKTAWGGGIIDRNTFLWGEDLTEWAPIHMIRGMERAIATWEVRLAALATSCLHKLQRGMPLWVPLKGFERKTYKQLQDEEYEERRREMAAEEANGGVPPGATIPSYALFLWAGGSNLTNWLQYDYMPNKFVPKDLRKQLIQLMPGLRPWEVLSLEQAMDNITYGGRWFREPLGFMSCGPAYIKKWNKSFKSELEEYKSSLHEFYKQYSEIVPDLDKIVDKMIELDGIGLWKEAKRKRAENGREMYRQIFGDRNNKK